MVCDRGELCVVPADAAGKAATRTARTTGSSIDRSRARFLADPAALWRHAYDEAGRIMRHDFWVADMAEVDWDAVLDQYRPLLDRIAAAGDFADVLWEIVRRARHLARLRQRRRGRRDGTARDARSACSAPTWSAAPDGSWRSRRVLPGESSDPRARSPLAAPGAQVAAGRRAARGGRAAGGPAAGPARCWSGAAGKPVELTVAPAAGGEPRRRGRGHRSQTSAGCATRTGSPAAARRVRELSGGRIGYLHVPDMVSEGWADFHRDLRAEMAREALIVDVRGNRGGHTSQLVVEKLARRVIGWDMPRGPAARSPTRSDAPRGPVVALTDEYAGSDGDIVTAAIKILGLGPVVGTRTWGGVIGIDGRCTSSSTAPR